MVQEREDSGLWIAYVMGEFVARLKSTMPYGDNLQGQDKLYVVSLSFTK